MLYIQPYLESLSWSRMINLQTYILCNVIYGYPKKYSTTPQSYNQPVIVTATGWQIIFVGYWMTTIEPLQNFGIKDFSWQEDVKIVSLDFQVKTTEEDILGYRNHFGIAQGFKTEFSNFGFWI